MGEVTELRDIGMEIEDAYRRSIRRAGRGYNILSLIGVASFFGGVLVGSSIYRPDVVGPNTIVHRYKDAEYTLGTLKSNYPLKGLPYVPENADSSLVGSVFSDPNVQKNNLERDIRLVEDDIKRMEDESTIEGREIRRYRDRLGKFGIYAFSGMFLGVAFFGAGEVSKRAIKNRAERRKTKALAELK